MAKNDITYYSSVKFYPQDAVYGTGVDDFGFLKNLYSVFDGE